MKITSLLFIFLLVSGCDSLKEAGWVSGIGMASGAAASVATGTLPAVAVGAGAAGLTAAIINDSCKASTSPATVTSGWGALAVLVQTSGKWLGICALTFILLGWLLPGPLKLNRRGRDSSG